MKFKIFLKLIIIFTLVIFNFCANLKSKNKQLYTDLENGIYNKMHLSSLNPDVEDEPQVSNLTFEGITKEMIEEVNKVVAYNRQHGYKPKKFAITDTN